MPMDFIKGELLLIDKPAGWTSFDVVNKIRRLLGKKLDTRLKVGHAGTLDPMATGLLLICTGGMTKKIESFTGLDKEYTGTFTLGATTPSHDSETELNQEPLPGHNMLSSQQSAMYKLTSRDILSVAEKFKGEILQVPPLYSAKWIDGKRAYVYARKNRDVELPPIPVTIHDFLITRIDLPEVDFVVTCSKGTYIRALARDFGKELGVGAYLSALRRTRIGDYSLDNALTIEQFEKQLSTWNLKPGT